MSNAIAISERLDRLTLTENYLAGDFGEDDNTTIPLRVLPSETASWHRSLLLAALAHDVGHELLGFQTGSDPRYASHFRQSLALSLLLANLLSERDRIPLTVLGQRSSEEVDTATNSLARISVDAIEQEIEALFRRAASEEFEDGKESTFVNELQKMVRVHGTTAVQAVHHLVLNEKVASDAAAEALRWLGDMKHEPTYHYRRWLLERALVSCSSPIVRDGANVGLGFMADPHAIPVLKKAIEETHSKIFRNVLSQTLIQLENVAECHRS